MKTVKSLADLHRLAMERGSTVVVSGRTINAAAEKLRVRPPRPVVVEPVQAAPEPAPPPPPPPPPVVEPGVPRAEVDRLLAEQEARWESRVQALTDKLVALTSVAKPTPPTWNFVPEYGPRGEFVALTATPTIKLSS